ncbi:MAG: cellulase family glycosylhydrolase [Gemmataceae bacterium]
MRWRTMVLGLLAVVGAIPAARGAEAGWFPFVLPWDDDSRTAVHVGALLPTPAGGDGFLQARDGHLVDGKGRRVRLLGVNFVFGANFPNKPDAAKLAARMRKFGINIVRLHHMDFYHAPRGIFDPAYRDNQHLDKEQLDRLDYLVHQLKEHGIYVNVNLHVSRHLNAADGFPDTDGLPRLGKAVSYYEPRMIELQKKYAKDLLDRVNPYTKTRYTEEPAVAVIELTNEDTLFGEAWEAPCPRCRARTAPS